MFCDCLAVLESPVRQAVQPDSAPRKSHSIGFQSLVYGEHWSASLNNYDFFACYCGSSTQAPGGYALVTRYFRHPV